MIEQTFDGWVGDVRIVDRPLAVDDFMLTRDPGVEARAGVARLEQRTVAIPLRGERARVDLRLTEGEVSSRALVNLHDTEAPSSPGRDARPVVGTRSG